MDTMASAKIIQRKFPTPTSAHPYWCQVKMGTPKNGDPGSLLSWDNRDPGPHYIVIMGIPDAHYHRDYGDPFVKIGIPINYPFKLRFSLPMAIPTVSTLLHNV